MLLLLGNIDIIIRALTNWRINTLVSAGNFWAHFIAIIILKQRDFFVTVIVLPSNGLCFYGIIKVSWINDLSFDLMELTQCYQQEKPDFLLSTLILSGIVLVALYLLPIIAIFMFIFTGKDIDGHEIHFTEFLFITVVFCLVAGKRFVSHTSNIWTTHLYIFYFCLAISTYCFIVVYSLYKQMKTPQVSPSNDNESASDGEHQASPVNNDEQTNSTLETQSPV